MLRKKIDLPETRKRLRYFYMAIEHSYIWRFSTQRHQIRMDRLKRSISDPTKVFRMLGKYRQVYQQKTAWLGKALAKTKLTPNMMSGIAFGMAIVTTIVLAQGMEYLILGAFLVAFTSVMDLFDGAIARATGHETRFGGVLDHTLDRYVEYLIILGLMLGGLVHWFWGVFALFGMMMPSSTKAKAQLLGVGDTQRGVAERTERQVLLILGIFLSAIFTKLSVPLPYPDSSAASGIALYDTNLLTIVVVVIGLLSHVTVIQRLKAVKKLEEEQAATKAAAATEAAA